jgi:hypothetical protein
MQFATGCNKYGYLRNFFMRKQMVVFIVLMALLPGCGPTIYKAQGFEQLTVSHKTAAVLPVAVHFKLKPREKRKTDSARLKQEEEKNGMAIQGKMYNWFLKSGDKYTVSFQDITRTNEILSQAGIQYADIETKTTLELAELLGVDVVIAANAVMKMPVSEGAAVVQAWLSGPYGIGSNEAEIFITAFDAAEGGVVWRYEFTATRSALMSKDELVNVLMKNAAKKFPYKHN